MSMPVGLAVRIDEQLRRASARTTEMIAKHWGKNFPMWIGCGYPKSGTVWLCKLMSNYLNAPYPQNYRLPIAMRSVVHAHWDYDSHLPKTAYIVRDGRDTIVSMYFHQLRTIQEGRNPRHIARLQQRFRHLFGRTFDPYAVRDNLPRFIDYEYEHPSSGHRTWDDHVRDWAIGSKENVFVVRYESLLCDTRAELANLMAAMTATPSDPVLIDLAVRRHEFSRVSGRRSGDEDLSSFQRKGVAGDWRNRFSRSAGEVFDARAGATLMALGYVDSRDWYGELSP